MASKKSELAAAEKAAAASSNPLTQAIGVLGKVFGKDDDSFVAIDEDRLTRSIPHIPTGSVIIDFLIGGKPNKLGVSPCPGLPRGKLVNLYGAESCGKTTLSLTAAASTIRQGGTVCYIDWEHAVDLSYTEGLGVPVRDQTKFALSQPQTLEKGLSILWTMAKAGVDLIVIDSVGSCVPQAVFDKTIAEQGERGQIGAVAAAWSGFLPKLRGIIARTGTCVIGVSQLRDSMNTRGYGGETTIQQGGKAWKFHSDVRLCLRKFATEKTKDFNTLMHTKEDTATGTVISARIDKCRIAASQGREAKFYIKFGDGIDDMRSIIEVASAHGVIKKGGAWYTWERNDGNTVRGQGLDQFRSEIRVMPGAWAELYKATLAVAVNVSDVVEDDDSVVEEDFSDIANIMAGGITGGVPEDGVAEAEPE